MSKQDETLREVLSKRSLLIDNMFNTQQIVEDYSLNDDDFKGTFLKNWTISLVGNMDVLSLSRPDVIEQLHKRNLEAGADIITTNTAMSQAVCQKKWGLDSQKYLDFLNRASVRIARFEAGKVSKQTPDKPRFVIGSIGPTSKNLSKPEYSPDSWTADLTFDQLESAYMQQMISLLEEGVDAIILDCIQDTLNVKAAISAFIKTKEIYHHIYERFNGPDYCPEIMFSAEIDEKGLTRSGQTKAAFLNSVRHANALFAGFNFREGKMYSLSKIEKVEEIHDDLLHLSNLEALDIKKEDLKIGNLCDINTNREFEVSIERNLDEDVLNLMRKQVKEGANVLRICLDLGWIDAKGEMCKLIRLVEADEELKKVPLMLASTNFKVINEALKVSQGHCLVERICLSEDEKECEAQKKTIERLGGELFI